MRNTLIVLALTTGSAAFAIDPASVAPDRRTVLDRYLTAGEAHEMVQARPAATLFIDVRTQAEASYVGIPRGLDANIPYLLVDFDYFDAKKRSYALHRNPHFVRAVAEKMRAKGLDGNADIVLICRSGDRTTRAVNDLAAAGFTRVWNVIDGFEGDLANDRRTVNGWKNAGLPWTYRLEPEQAWVAPGSR